MNKNLILNTYNVVESNPSAWHTLFEEVLRVYHTFQKNALGTSPFTLTCGYNAIWPIELARQVGT
ncbi:unnamed protein product, partial [Dovyalis caffra]